MNRMRALLLAGLGALLLTAAPSQAVIGGQPDGDGHPYVGLMWNLNTGTICSGALISPTLYVTAAHCFRGSGDFAVVTVDRQASPSSAFVPGFATVDPEFCVGCGPGLPGFDSHDVAYIRLLFPIFAERYASLAEVGLSDRLGRAKLTVVGYGVQGFQPVEGGLMPYSNFERTAGTVDLIPSRHSWRDEFLRISSSTTAVCYGDSGGPVLLGDTIVAINSYTTQYCAGVAYAYRMDTPAAHGFVEHG